MADHTFAEVNFQRSKPLCLAVGIQALPTLQVYSKGKCVAETTVDGLESFKSKRRPFTRPLSLSLSLAPCAARAG